jgi:hypothetical protein
MNKKKRLYKEEYPQHYQQYEGRTAYFIKQLFQDFIHSVGF